LTFCSSGTLKYRPAFDCVSMISPSWNLIAYLRWSTVYIDCDATRSTATISARIGIVNFMAGLRTSRPRSGPLPLRGQRTK
jgi:hypothetical protein